MDEKSDMQDKEHKQTDKHGTIRRLLLQCVHGHIAVHEICDLIVGYVPHNTIRACSLLLEPFRIIDTLAVNEKCQTISLATFDIGTDGVGQDQVKINETKKNCGPPVEPSKEWTIERKGESESKDNKAVNTQTITHTRKDKTHSVVLRSFLAPLVSFYDEVPMCISPDKKTVIYETTSHELIDGKAQYQTTFEFESYPSTRRTTIVIRDISDQYFCDTYATWLHGNRHVALISDENQMLVIHLPDREVIYSKKETAITVMSRRDMKRSWTKKQVHTFPVLFTGEVRFTDANPARNEFIVETGFLAWIIRFRDNTWWIARKFDDVDEFVEMKWNLSGTHLILKNTASDIACSMRFDKEEDEEQELQNPGMTTAIDLDLPDAVENDPQVEFGIARRLFDFFWYKKDIPIRIKPNGPFFVVYNKSWIAFFCRETGDQLQMIRMDETKEICLHCKWNASNTRLFVLVEDKGSHTFRILTLGNSHFEKHLQTTYASYPNTRNCPSLFPLVMDKFKKTGFFL